MEIVKYVCRKNLNDWLTNKTDLIMYDNFSENNDFGEDYFINIPIKIITPDMKE